jgi:DNA helicase-2/ATP-dependent DNA helicase PcrA
MAQKIPKKSKSTKVLSKKKINRPVVLSTEQEKVVNHRGGHLQVVACAGAGKTEAIASRVTSLIGDGVEPGQIIAFTFTERAAASLKTRITKRVVQTHGDVYLDRLGPMFVGTIHGYCWRLLQEHVPRFGDFEVLDDNRLAGLLSREFKSLGLKELGDTHWKTIEHFIRNANVIENELIDIKKIPSSEFGLCYQKYKSMLVRYHFVTYGLLITGAIKALTEEPRVAQRVHGNLRHLIVDEYQDVNSAQDKLISLLAKPPVQLCVVADDDQAIYQWRGSDVSNMIDFKKRYKRSTTLTLSTNRRSRPTIIQKANEFAETISPRLKKKMEPVRPSKKTEFHCWVADTAEKEAEVIASTIEKLAKKGVRYKNIAILFRSVSTSSPPFIQALEDRGIPYTCSGRTGLFLQPEADLLGKTHAWLIGNYWKNERYNPGEHFDLDEIVQEYRRIFKGGRKILGLEKHLLEWKTEVQSPTRPSNLVRELYELLNLLGIHRLDLNDTTDSARIGCLARFSQILADFEHVKRRARYVNENDFQGGQDRGEWLYRSLFNYLQFYALNSYEDFGGEESIIQDAVDILTIHKSKGLEWSVVFMPSLVERRFPALRTGRQQEWMLPESVFSPLTRSRYEGTDADERRLFYVGITRAKDVAYLSGFNWISKRKKLSPYLLEVGDGLIPLVESLPIPSSVESSQDKVSDLPNVSFSDLASYEDCPLRFRLSTSFGFQPQLATELGYGKAIHHILRQIADRSKELQRMPTDAEVEATLDKSFYLPFATKIMFEKLRGEAKKLVRKYLSEYRSDLTRIWETERPFELHLENGVISGRTDVILDKERDIVNNLAFVDYKTSSDTSADEIHAFQLAVYAAAGRGEGLNVSAAYLHHMKTSTRRGVPVDEEYVSKAKDRAVELLKGMTNRAFPPRPEKTKCQGCDMRLICKHSKHGKGCS